MTNTALTIVFCGLLPTALVVVAAVWGMSRRMRHARQVMSGYKKGDFKDLSTPQHAPRIRGLAILAAASIVGILGLTALVLTDVFYLLSPQVLIGYIVLASIGIIAGLSLYRDVTRRIK